MKYKENVWKERESDTWSTETDEWKRRKRYQGEEWEENGKIKRKQKIYNTYKKKMKAKRRKYWELGEGNGERGVKKTRRNKKKLRRKKYNKQIREGKRGNKK